MMHPNYFTVLGYNKDDGSYTHFTDCSSFPNAERYARYLLRTAQAKPAGGSFDQFEVWDINKNRVAVLSPDGGKRICEGVTNADREDFL
jgi:hypothetical protein|nr:MAG TPA: hypothetical protein [Caudoviricetes sp.]